MNKNDGEILVTGDIDAHLKDLPEMVETLFQQIHSRYPMAFSALVERYAASRANIRYFKYLCVRRFLMCNFGEYDLLHYDIDENGKWNMEKVRCPLRGECRWENIICQPVPGTCLSSHEREIVSLLCEGVPLGEIATRHHISLHTVRNHRRNIYRKLGIHNLRALMAWYNNILSK